GGRTRRNGRRPHFQRGISLELCLLERWRARVLCWLERWRARVRAPWGPVDQAPVLAPSSPTHRRLIDGTGANRRLRRRSLLGVGMCGVGSASVGFLLGISGLPFWRWV